jgi:hypothetical protein
LSPAVLLQAPSSAAAATNTSAVSVFIRLLLVPVEGKPTIAQNDSRLCKRGSYSTVQVFEAMRITSPNVYLGWKAARGLLHWIQLPVLAIGGLHGFPSRNSNTNVSDFAVR